MKKLSAPDEYLICANLQDDIGYYNFWFARIATTWRNLQRDRLCLKYKDRRHSADAWAKQLVCKLYRLTHNIWRHRCERVHGKDKKKASKRERKALRKEIHLQYALGSDTVLACHRDLLSQPKKNSERDCSCTEILDTNAKIESRICT